MTCTELLELKENSSFEAKSAQGRDGNGELPHDFWETYSAFANTNGGYVLLGAKEKSDKSLQLIGIKNLQKVKKELFDGLNNPKQVSFNLLQDRDIEEIECDGVTVLLVNIPRAKRQSRPVFIGSSPLSGSYRRGHEGDYKIDPDTVKRMLADAASEPRDSQHLEQFSIDDLDRDSLRGYRNVFNATNVNHPWSTKDDKDFLKSLGGWFIDRESGHEGLTAAGLLMFGTEENIKEALPFYFVDYQEKMSEDPQIRWDDRVIPDGRWSGNLYDFYRKVYSKLVADVKVPFRLKNSHQRIDESEVHEAVREAFVNTLIHADYTGQSGIVIKKEKEGFRFRNPGTLRLPKDQIFHGGISDCRNQSLQKMFRMIGAGEQAGSGYSRITHAWMEQDWQFPTLSENLDPDYTELNLPIVSLVPQEIEEHFVERFGDKYYELDARERFVLVMAIVEQNINNAKLQEVFNLHPAEITKILKSLVDRDFLFPDGLGRGTKYHLAHDESMQHLDPSLQHLDPSLQHLDPSLQQIPIVEEVRRSKKTSPEKMREAILSLCADRFLTKREIAILLNRKEASLKNHYLTPMANVGQLEKQYEDDSHPQQAYRTKEVL